MNLRPDTDSLQVHAFEALIAFAALLASILFFTPAVELRSSTVGQTLHPWDIAWNALFGLSGALILVGLAFPRYLTERLHGHALELGGLIMLATAILVNLIASVVVLGPAPAQATLAGTLVATILRARTLLSPRLRLTTVEIRDTSEG